MIRLFLLIFCLISLPSFADAACSHAGSTWTAASVSMTDVQACVTAFTSGGVANDTIAIPAGTDTTTWLSGGISLPAKDVIISGAGTANTVITCVDYCFLFSGSANTEFTQIALNTAHAGSYGFLRIAGGMPTVGKYFNVHHNIFLSNATNSFSTIVVEGNVDTDCTQTAVAPQGLFHHNTLTNTQWDINGTTCQQGSSWLGTVVQQLWDHDPRLSTPTGAWPQAVYMEDNTINITSSGFIDAVESNNGAKWVFRFNTIQGTNALSDYLGTHGVQSRNRGVNWVEVYKNTWTIGTPAFCGLICPRAGTGIFFGNNVDQNTPQPGMDVERSYSAPNGGRNAGGANQCDGTDSWDGNTIANGLPGQGYPCRDQIGRMRDTVTWIPENGTYTQPLDPLYWFQNYKNVVNGSVTGATTILIPGLYGSTTANYVAQNREWYLEDSSNCPAIFTGNCTAGIGIGTLANRPSSCTIGTGYWATDQGEWNSNQAGKDGQLYKCTGVNSWSLYFIPFGYPHFLQGGGGGGGGGVGSSSTNSPRMNWRPH